MVIPRERTSLLALAAWMAFAALFMYAVLVGGSWLGIYVLPLRVVSLALVAGALGGWFVLSLRRPGWRPASAIWPAFAGALGALALATLASRFPRLGLEYVAWAMLLVALYLLLVRVLATPFARARVGMLAALVGLVIGVMYLAWVSLAWLEWWDLVGRLAVPPLRPHTFGLTYRNPNALATVEVLLAVVAFAGLGPGSTARRTLLVLVTLVTAAVVVVTGSRSAWLGIGGSALLLGGLWLAASMRRGRLRGLRVDRRGALLLGGIAVGLLMAAVLLGPSIAERVLDGSDGGRGVYFATAVRMFQSAPLLGTGPGTWAVLRASSTQPGELDWYVTHAHNMALQTLAEVGLAGVLAGLVALGALGWLLWRASRDTDATRRRWAWAALAALLYVAFTGLVDNYANMPAVMLLGAVPVALLDATSDRTPGLPGLSRVARARAAWVARAAFWVACLAALLVLVRTESIAAEHARAVTLIDQGAWAEAAEPAVGASSADPDMIAYQVTRAQVASALGDWATAREAYTIAAGADDLPASWLGLAQAQLELGEPQPAVTGSLARALRIGDQQPGILYAAAALYERLGLRAEADAAYAGAIALMPSLAADPWWLREAAMAPRFPGLLDQAIERSGGSGWVVALMAEDVERARAVAASPGSSDRIRLIIEAWSGDAEAARSLLAQATSGPGDAWLQSWASLIGERGGDTREAERLRRLATFNWEGGDLPGYRFVRGRDDDPGGVPAGTRGAYYGEWLYRRSMPIRQLPPGLPQLEYVGLGRGGGVPSEASGGASGGPAGD